MMPLQFVHTLQMTDSLFPVGGFAYSDGLETAAASGRVHDSTSLANWIDCVRDAVFVPCDGLALLKCFSAAEALDWATIVSIDDELSAIKPAAAARASSRSVGRRLLTTYVALFNDGPVAEAMKVLPHCNAPVAYGVALSRMGLEARDALLAFGYLRTAGLVSAGLRLVSIGQQQGQAVLTRALVHLPAAVDNILRMEEQPLRCFAPIAEIQQMNHQYIYSRLFRS